MHGIPTEDYPPVAAAPTFFRSLRLSLRNSWREILLCMALGLIPWLGWAICFVISSYYLGMVFMDHSYSRHEFSIRKGAAFTRRNKGIAIGLGMAVNLGLLVPIVGWLLVPSFATVGATLAIVPKLQEQPDASSTFA